MELKNLSRLEKKAASNSRLDFSRLGAALLFMVVVFVYATAHAGGLPESNPQAAMLLVIAALFGAYMAMNIGANDVANNMGPTVGSRALTMGGAIAVAAIFEMLGAVIAGGEVVATIKNGIIDPKMIGDVTVFVWLMMAALLAGAIWLNLATAVGAPVSTTHSIVGAVLGAGIAAGGWDMVNWGTMGAIVASWVVSPVMGGAIAALLLYTIKRTITYQTEMTCAAARVVPWLVALMAWAFGTYMLIKGLGQLYKVAIVPALGWGFVFGVVVYLAVRPLMNKAASRCENNKEAVNGLFTIPLIFSAALLSFAHGANDVANAIGPLAAINEALFSGTIAGKAAIPMWVMLVGAIGLAVGLALYGPRLIKTVGGEITDLDKMRAYCIAMASALTVIAASQLGLPISTTHVAIGAVFGVGFLREYLKTNHARMEQIIITAHEGEEKSKIEAYLTRFNAAPLVQKAAMLAAMKKKAAAKIESDPLFSKKERKALKKVYKQELVKRSMVVKIAAAWVITVPATALLAAVLFKLIETLFA